MRPDHPAAVAALAVSAAIFTGCGGSGKPAYCGNLSTLERSVKSINPTAGLDALKTQVGQIAGDAANVVSSAKSDFPDQTAAIDTSLTKLKTSLKSVTSSPSPQDLVAVVSDAEAMVKSVNQFLTAAKSKCG